jgi:hypothetical protein
MEACVPTILDVITRCKWSASSSSHIISCVSTRRNHCVGGLDPGKLEQFATCNIAVLKNPYKDVDYATATFPVTKTQTPWPLVRKRTIPTERPPLVVSEADTPRSLISIF